MSELALYRKYRSSSFDEVVGQAHVIQTLTTALASGRISHAYLFTGPRGVGKTSVARLLARSVNCTGSKAKPCGECDNCLAETHLDLIEIDAASNRRIDEIRDLRDKIGLSPAMGKFKVYIIDEVHMLTNEAFNALLKTLEEPPAHAIFILATTEAHKLPATVISRTQRFNFKPILSTDMADHLQKLAKLEKLNLTPEAAELLAEAAKGSLRDAISMLDQLASAGAAKIDAAVLRAALGWSDNEAIAAISLAIAENKTGQALKSLDKALEQGAQVSQIITQLLTYWRNLMLKAVRQTSVSAESEAEAIITKLSLNRLVLVIETLAKSAKSSWPQLALEAAIVKLTAQAPTLAPRPSKTESAPAAPEPAPTARPKETASSAPAPAASADHPDLWLKALMIIKHQNNSLYAVLRSSGSSLEGDRLTLTCRFNFYRQRLEETKNRQLLEQALAKVYGRKILVTYQVEAPSAPITPEPNSELVSSALEILGGEVVDE